MQRSTTKHEKKEPRIIVKKTNLQKGDKPVIVKIDTTSKAKAVKTISKSIKTEKDGIDGEIHNNELLDNCTIKPKKKNGVHLIIDEVIDENLCDDGIEIKKIYHLSDIHISKNDDRHDEYLAVFKNLVNEIKKDTQNAIIVICGDILHEKNTLSPQQLLLAKNLFIMLSDLLPCFVIIGNHDISPVGNVIDSITPILKKLDTKNKIYLLLEDKCYYYNNLVFGLTSMFTKNVTPCVVENKIKIGLYHGTLIGTKVENGHVLTESGIFNMSDFKKYYDYVLLGDIHKHMYLDAKKTVAYSGSLLQTRFGEDLIHGIIKWDLDKKTSNFIKINNNHGFVNLKCNKDGIIGNLKTLPKIPFIKMEYEDITHTEAEKYANILRSKFNAKCELTCSLNKNMEIQIGNGKNKKTLLDINNDDTVIAMIIDYTKQSHNYDPKLIKEIETKLRAIIKLVNHNYSKVVKKLN